MILNTKEHKWFKVSFKALPKRLALRKAKLQPVAACDNPSFMFYHLPGARTSGLPFEATVF